MAVDLLSLVATQTVKIDIVEERPLGVTVAFERQVY